MFVTGRKIIPRNSQLLLPGLPQSTPQVRATPQTCRTSSTASSKERLLTTWLPTGASSPQVPPLTRRLAPECLLSPLPRARPASTCQEATGLIPASRGPKAANLPGGGRKSGNPSRGEEISQRFDCGTTHDGHVCLSVTLLLTRHEREWKGLTWG